MLKKNTLREIRSSLGRYIAILAIVALGVGFFSGLKVTRPAMLATAGDYLADSSFFDYQIMSTLGFEDRDVSALAALEDVSDAEGSISCDVLFTPENGNGDGVLKLHTVPKKINTLILEAGRLPKKADECVVDYRLFDENPVGQKLRISENNDKNTLELLKYREYTIVGTVISPIYLNLERGTTSLGNGSVSGFAYLDRQGFDTDFFTEIYLKMQGSWEIYSNAYKDMIEENEDTIRDAADRQADRRYQSIVSEAEKELAEGQAEYDKNYAAFLSEKKSALAKLDAAGDRLAVGQAEIKSGRQVLDRKEQILRKKQQQTEAGFAELKKQKEAFEAGKPHMTLEQIAQTEKTLAAAGQKLSQASEAIRSGFAQIRTNRDKLNRSEAELQQGFTDYYNSRNDARAEFQKAESEFRDARQELKDAAQEIQEIDTPDTYVLDRNANVGYLCFESDSNIINGIARVFPIFFFLVAALVCMTTMTRMVDEQRTQIGVMKALGYSSSAIITKYLFYAGSASFLGCTIGFFSCCYIFPLVIWNAYGMMYDFSTDLYYIIDGPLGLLSLGVSLLCSMGATALSCYAEFREVPAQLIRPKAPKEGKRILLERIPFIWNRLSFLYKVSFRNIFRYKKRFLMMVLGISGCTALLVTGLGVRDSIKNVVDYQFDEIQVYDYSITFDRNMNSGRQQRFLESAKSYTDDLIFLHQGSAELVAGKNIKSVSLIAADSKNFSSFIKLFDAEKQKLSYPEKGEAVICKKLADTYHLSEGSRITVRDPDLKEMTLTVSGVCENYIDNYIYVSPASCEEGFGYTPEIKTALVKASQTGEAEPDNQAIHASSASALKETGVMTVSVNNDMRNRVSNMMQSLDYVIALVILSAGALAFIVLYNLTNINITERIREIATIKVLGFYPGETSAYVFRENLFLTGISAVAGLLLGKWLHAFVMAQIQVDMISFDVRITGLSYLLSVVFTFVFAIIVNLAMYRRIDKISMTESLKSIE